MSVEITVPGYSIVKKITDGGSASIFKAKKHPYDNFVALKVLLPQFMAQKEMIRAFEREAAILGKLKHPNIIKFGAFVKDAPRPAVELELFESVTLKQLIAKSGGKLGVPETAKIMKQLAEALSYIHALEIAHLDIKPENILVDDKLVVRLIDFSIARECKRSISDRLFGMFAKKGDTVTIQGTITYLSPEQIKQENIGPAADIYALGLVVYECYTGGPPFRGHDQKTIMKQHLSESAPGLDRARPEVPLDIVELFKKMVEKEPLRRPDATTVAQTFAKHAG